MIGDDIFVIDGIIHPFKLAPERRIGRNGESLIEHLIGSVTRWCPPGWTGVRPRQWLEEA